MALHTSITQHLVRSRKDAAMIARKHFGYAALLWMVVGSTACDRPGDASSMPPAAEAPVAPAPKPTLPPLHPVVSDPAALTADAQLGKPAPDFTLSGVDGKTYKLSELKGKTVVLEWFNPDCPFVKYARGEGELKTMAGKVMSDSLVWLSINSSGPGKQGNGLERNQAAISEYGFTNPILLDESGAVGKSYGALKTPTLFIVGKDGALIYRGGIDNAPIGTVDITRPRLPDSKEGELINYVKAALDDYNAARALRLPDTPPYGCSVKYSS
jgi:hypothetical protein